MDELDGRPHWGKRHFQTAATLRARYPEWDRFQARARAAGPAAAASPTTGPSACSARRRAPVRSRRAWPRPAARHALRRPTRAWSARPRGCRRRSRSSTSTRWGQRRQTWNGAPPASRSGSRASRVRCRALQERVLGARRLRAARSRSRCPRRCGWPRTASTTSSSPIRPPIAARCASWPSAPSRAPSAIAVMVDSAEQLDADRAGARRGRRRRSARVHRRRRRAGARSAGACASAPSARRCTRPSRPPRSPARSSRASAAAGRR